MSYQNRSSAVLHSIETDMSRIMRKPSFCICENKDADHLRGYREADQRLCFRYIDSTIPLLSNSEIQASSHLLQLYSLICVGPGPKPDGCFFSWRGSYNIVIKIAISTLSPCHRHFITVTNLLVQYLHNKKAN